MSAKPVLVTDDDPHVRSARPRNHEGDHAKRFRDAAKTRGINEAVATFGRASPRCRRFVPAARCPDRF